MRVLRKTMSMASRKRQRMHQRGSGGIIHVEGDVPDVLAQVEASQPPDRDCPPEGSGGYDPYSHESIHTSDFTSTPWVRPDFKSALESTQRKVFQQGKANYWTTGYEELASISVGVGLYFKMTMFLVKVFAVGSLFLIPAVVFNFCGEAISSTEVDSLQLARSTAGNLGQAEAGTNQTLRLCFYNADLGVITYAVSFIDALLSIAFLVVWFYLSRLITATSEEFDFRYITPSDYTVQVEGLPRDAKKEEILDHFDRLGKLVNRDGAGAEQEGPVDWVDGATSKDFICKCLDKRRPRIPFIHPCEVWASGKSQKLMPGAEKTGSGRWISNVVVVSPAHRSASYYRKMQKLGQHLRTKCAHAKMVHSMKRGEKAIAAAVEAVQKVKRQIMHEAKRVHAATKGLESEHSQTLGAYVTFNNEASVARVLEDYEGFIRMFPKMCATAAAAISPQSAAVRKACS